MCGRYTLRNVEAALAAMSATPDRSFAGLAARPRYNVAPSQPVPVVRLDEDGRRSLGAVKWGLVPSWAKGPPKVRPINARAETVAASGMFRGAFAKRRCLVPADGFYEWQRSGDGKTKQPMFVRFPDDRVFGFAAVWERWRQAEGDDPLDTVAVVTTAPNAVMRPIHDRMPVILPPDRYGSWLDPRTPAAEAAKLLRPYPDGELVAVPVGRTVNSPRNDGPECVCPLA